MKLLTEALQWFYDSNQNKIMTGKVHQDLARTYAKMGDYEKAKYHFEKTYALFDVSGGEKHTLTGNCSKEFAEMLLKFKKYKPALKLFKEALTVETRKDGVQPQFVFNILHQVLDIINSKMTISESDKEKEYLELHRDIK